MWSWIKLNMFWMKLSFSQGDGRHLFNRFRALGVDHLRLFGTSFCQILQSCSASVRHKHARCVSCFDHSFGNPLLDGKFIIKPFSILPITGGCFWFAFDIVVFTWVSLLHVLLIFNWIRDTQLNVKLRCGSLFNWQKLHLKQQTVVWDHQQLWRTAQMKADRSGAGWWHTRPVWPRDASAEVGAL